MTRRAAMDARYGASRVSRPTARKACAFLRDRYAIVTSGDR